MQARSKVRRVREEQTRYDNSFHKGCEQVNVETAVINLYGVGNDCTKHDFCGMCNQPAKGTPSTLITSLVTLRHTSSGAAVFCTSFTQRLRPVIHNISFWQKESIQSLVTMAFSNTSVTSPFSSALMSHQI